MSREEDIQHSFDAYCKRLVRNKARDIQRETARQREHEVSFSELTRWDLQNFQNIDHYSFEKWQFIVLNTTVEIENESLGCALDTLSPERRDIILSSYFLGMTDDEIAEELHLHRSTVQYRRTSALKELRKLLEGYKDEQAPQKTRQQEAPEHAAVQNHLCGD